MFQSPLLNGMEHSNSYRRLAISCCGIAKLSLSSDREDVRTKVHEILVDSNLSLGSSLRPIFSVGRSNAVSHGGPISGGWIICGASGIGGSQRRPISPGGIDLGNCQHLSVISRNGRRDQGRRRQRECVLSTSGDWRQILKAIAASSKQNSSEPANFHRVISIKQHSVLLDILDGSFVSKC